MEAGQLVTTIGVAALGGICVLCVESALDASAGQLRAPRPAAAAAAEPPGQHCRPADANDDRGGESWWAGGTVAAKQTAGPAWPKRAGTRAPRQKRWASGPPGPEAVFPAAGEGAAHHPAARPAPMSLVTSPVPPAALPAACSSSVSQLLERSALSAASIDTTAQSELPSRLERLAACNPHRAKAGADAPAAAGRPQPDSAGRSAAPGDRSTAAGTPASAAAGRPDGTSPPIRYRTVDVTTALAQAHSMLMRFVPRNVGQVRMLRQIYDELETIRSRVLSPQGKADLQMAISDLRAVVARLTGLAAELEGGVDGGGGDERWGSNHSAASSASSHVDPAAVIAVQDLHVSSRHSGSHTVELSDSFSKFVLGRASFSVGGGSKTRRHCRAAASPSHFRRRLNVDGERLSIFKTDSAPARRWRDLAWVGQGCQRRCGERHRAAVLRRLIRIFAPRVNVGLTRYGGGRDAQRLWTQPGGAVGAQRLPARLRAEGPSAQQLHRLLKRLEARLEARLGGCLWGCLIARLGPAGAGGDCAERQRTEQLRAEPKPLGRPFGRRWDQWRWVPADRDKRSDAAKAGA